MSDKPQFPRTINLTVGALSGLALILRHDGWTKEPASEAVENSWRGGQIIDTVLPEEPEGRPAPLERDATVAEQVAYQKAIEAHENREAAPFSLTRKQFAACQKAVKWAAVHAGLPNSKHKNALISQFDLFSDDE